MYCYALVNWSKSKVNWILLLLCLYHPPVRWRRFTDTGTNLCSSLTKEVLWRIPNHRPSLTHTCRSLAAQHSIIVVHHHLTSHPRNVEMVQSCLWCVRTYGSLRGMQVFFPVVPSVLNVAWVLFHVVDYKLHFSQNVLLRFLFHRFLSALQMDVVL